jgi:hypothetical protein
MSGIFRREKATMKRTKLLAGLLALCAIGLSFFNHGDVNAATLTTRVVLQLDGSLTSALDLVTASAPTSFRQVNDLAQGVGANQADQIWSDQRTLSAGANEDLDLKGTLLDAFGVAFTPSKVRVLIIRASSANTNDLVLFGDANSVPFLNTAATTSNLKPGGTLVLVAPNLAGVTVTAGTGDIVQIANGGGGTSVTYDIVVVGASS